MQKSILEKTALEINTKVWNVKHLNAPLLYLSLIPVPYDLCNLKGDELWQHSRVAFFN